MIPEVVKTHARIVMEREALLKRFRAEFEHEPKSDKLDRVLDNMVGPRKRGRPAGSKNKAQPVVVNPRFIGSIPENDLIIRRD